MLGTNSCAWQHSTKPSPLAGGFGSLEVNQNKTANHVDGLILVEVIALLAKHEMRSALQQFAILPEDDSLQLVSIAPRHQTQRRLTAEQMETLVVEYVNGASVPVLAKEFQVHRTTVMHHLEREGVPRRACVRRLTDDDVIEAAGYYRDGESLATVAARFGVNATTVAREFARARVETRPRNGRLDRRPPQ